MEILRLKQSLRTSAYLQRLYIECTTGCLLTLLALYLAILLRFDFHWDTRLETATLLTLLGWLTLAKLVCYQYFEVSKRTWRYFAIPDAIALAKAHFTASVSMLIPLFLIQPSFFPRSIVVLEFLLSLTGAMVIRLICRIYWESRAIKSDQTYASAGQVLILGAGASGHLVVKTLLAQRKMGLTVKGVLDDNHYLWGSCVHGVPILGPLAELTNCLTENHSINSVILAIPTLEGRKVKEIEAATRAFDLPLKTIQSFEDIACHEVNEPTTKRTIEQLLEREVIVEHDYEVLKALRGRKILVTGAAGSIGSEIVRQVLGFQPQSVTLVDQSEFQLFSLEQELNAETIPKLKNVEKNYIIADITNRVRMESIIANCLPEIVLHAAAYKHVPLMEMNCYEAFTTNVIGTRNILELASIYGAERFVLISTDKAVDPSSVMGSSKRIAEMMVESFGNQYANKAKRNTGTTPPSKLLKLATNPTLCTAAVRFGNVINSSGSVIPTFKKQILAGKPLTVTHQEMTRYFMSIKQAVRLVLTAGTLGKRGEIYLLDMGKPIKIVDVARKLRALYGRRDIPIQFTGLRPGEKLYEELVSQVETISPSPFKQISIVRSTQDHAVDIFAWIDSFAETLPSLTDSETGKQLRQFVLSMQQKQHVANSRPNRQAQA